MKKRDFKFLIVGLLILSAFLINVHAQSPEVSDVLKEQFNISSDKIPTDPEEIKYEFLKQKWTELIEKNKYLGPIHNFLANEKTQWVFKILLAKEYELSVTFLFSLILWILIFTQSAKIIKSSAIVKKEIAFLMGFFIAVIFAQLKIINFIVVGIVDIMLKQENWWLRLIIGIVALGLFASLYIISKMISQTLKQQHLEKVAKENEQQLNTTKTLTKEALSK